MANTKSAEKRHRQSLKRRARNVTVRGEVKTAVKSAREALTTKAGNTADALKAASKALNKAASKGVLHKRTASRRISRLAKAATKAARA
ncbi:30S ribosomal protein S20 [Pyxidicoccus xibeiensis]|uniref:30S ribosomal protein S20 n=1 Tax=Pyxidicoccus xibeiensis TaxID=2906759 RepID=UPI0020A7ACDB|nr:30S ribosomal protein S20 [Pyxidicoccus xibeiensis]MCP3144777.1 30S ribosomal protein S20 [Pyxidicoccus xibeiensis]